MSREQFELCCQTLPTKPCPEQGRILVTGATGYIGGLLVPELLARGYRIRVMVRAASPEHSERWPDCEIAVADVQDPDSLRPALRGIHTAYYLIHSLLLGPKDFAPAEIQGAINFGQAAAAEHVQRIIYLGGLGDVRSRLSAHLRTRMQVGEVLMQGKVATTVLRAAVIIGSGSASYEIIKHLIQNLPVILVPFWARTKCQPIAVHDVLRYLVGALESPETAGHSYDIGGTDILTYEEMMRILASLMRRRRLFAPCPVASIRLFSYAASFLTPVPAPIIFCLMEGLRNDVVCQHDDIRGILGFRTEGYREAVVNAMTREEQDAVHTRWSDAYPPAHELAVKLSELGEEVRYQACYWLETDKSANALFQRICRIGGKEGWFHSNWMWRLRGAIDRLLMGVGSSRGRRSLATLRINDVVDFWRVEDIRKNERLLLRAEMKLPGWAWLKFTILPAADDKRRLQVQAFYQTKTLFGHFYWYMFLPFHWIIFRNLIKQIERRS